MTSQLTENNIKDYQLARDKLMLSYTSMYNIYVSTANEGLKKSLKSCIEDIDKELIEHSTNISKFQKAHNHHWKAVYREDGETHGKCIVCDEHEWRHSKDCPY